MLNVRFHSEEQLAQSRVDRASETMIKSGSIALAGALLSGVAESVTSVNFIPDNIQTITAGAGFILGSAGIAITAYKDRKTLAGHN